METVAVESLNHSLADLSALAACDLAEEISYGLVRNIDGGGGRVGDCARLVYQLSKQKLVGAGGERLKEWGGG